MPEGPEIRIAADQVEKAVIMKPLLEVRFGLPDLKSYDEWFAGNKVKAIQTKGKALLTHFDNGYTIYSHNQLYGKWYVTDSFTYPKTNRQLRLALHTEDKSALLYSASDIQVLKTEDVPMHPFVKKVGPDVLSEDVTAYDLKLHMEDQRFFRRNLGGLLLDQAFVAGIGNYLRTEILFVTGIHPAKRPFDLSAEKRYELAKAVIQLMERAYRTKGITLDPEIVARKKAAGEPRSQYRHFAFNRHMEPCYQCGGPIEKINVASRRLYVCPRCQPN